MVPPHPPLPPPCPTFSSPYAQRRCYPTGRSTYRPSVTSRLSMKLVSLSPPPPLESPAAALRSVLYVQTDIHSLLSILLLLLLLPLRNNFEGKETADACDLHFDLLPSFHLHLLLQHPGRLQRHTHSHRRTHTQAGVTRDGKTHNEKHRQTPVWRASIRLHVHPLDS